MKSRLHMALLSAVVFAVGAAWVSGQRVGGYKEIDKDDEGAVAAAEFALEEQSRKQEMTYELVSIDKAESQTVAGINYRLCLKVGYHKEDDDVEATEFVRVVVFRNLQGKHLLTSWAQEDCGDGVNF